MEKKVFYRFRSTKQTVRDVQKRVSEKERKIKLRKHNVMKWTGDDVQD